MFKTYTENKKDIRNERQNKCMLFERSMMSVSNSEGLSQKEEI